MGKGMGQAEDLPLGRRRWLGGKVGTWPRTLNFLLLSSSQAPGMPTCHGGQP